MADALLVAHPEARTQDNTIIATWSFAETGAPADFTVTVTERVSRDRERPVLTLGPIKLERRVGGSTVDWVATITLPESAEDRAFRLRTNTGHPVGVGDATRAPERAPGPPPDAVDELVDLRNLLDQQPDGGREMLSRLLPSADPDQLRADIDAELERAIDPDTRPIWPLSGLFKPDVDKAALDAFVAAYGLPKLTTDDVQSTRYQTKEDWARYASAKGAPWFHAGGEMERPLSEELERPSVEMTYDVRPGEVVDGSISMALFADYANGLYAPRAIADQIVRSQLPYAFHLGDVYYGGTQTEFANHFESPLAPMFDRTELFMITGNHEMFARGEWFKKSIRRKAAEHPARQRQRAECFRLRGDGFQIIGLDTMFVGWKSGRVRTDDYADDDRLALLRGWLMERPDDLTILLTTNHAWDKGKNKTTRLYESLRGTIAGRVDLWFWGNVHYAALFDLWPFADTGAPTRRMVTSCIGHGGYPFYTEEHVGALPGGLQCRWLETRSRFYPDALRNDVGLNGWCRMKLTRSNEGWDVGLTYIDWVGRERCRAHLARKDGGGIYFKSVEESEIASVGAQPTWHSRPLGTFR